MDAIHQLINNLSKNYILQNEGKMREIFPPT